MNEHSQTTPEQAQAWLQQYGPTLPSAQRTGYQSIAARVDHTANRIADDTFRGFLAQLYRGGAYSYWWINYGTRRWSDWWPVGEPSPVPTGKCNVYFGVHPVTAIPLTNARGEDRPPVAVRAQIPYIAAINCLFAEFDAKDFGGSKQAILDHIQNLPISPSVIIDSGGGYHCYWLLAEPFVLDGDAARTRADRLQKAWVDLVGGDDGAKDLARVLRVPGTHNFKDEYGPDFPVVKFVFVDLERVYRLDELEAAIPASSGRNGHHPRSDKVHQAQAALERLAQWRCDDYNGWIEVGMMLSELGEMGLDLWDRWSQGSSKYEPEKCAEKWKTFTPGQGLTLGSLFHWANQDDPASSQRHHPRSVEARLSTEESPRTQETAPLEPPDPELKREIIRTLLGEGLLGKPPTLRRRQRAGELLLAWLRQHGDFVQSTDGDLFYFYRPQRRLFELDTERWAGWLYVLTGANPASADFAYLMADCKTAALMAERRKMVRVASWDRDAQVLRVSRFDGTVYVLDGETIQEELNGEYVLFNDDPLWQPYVPNFEEGGRILHRLTEEVPNWDVGESAEAGPTERRLTKMYGLALRAWYVTIFFTELCPTRPILVMEGEKGSGKSMTLRLTLRAMFGPDVELSGVPTKPDGFTAAAAASHLLVLDNLDDLTPWLRDKLARLATGAVDQYRKLYTSNEVGRVRYRCWLAVTSRNPDTLRRDDLADRLVLLPTRRFEEGEPQAERTFHEEIEASRNAWWGDMLLTLNRMVAAIRQGELRSQSDLRMADWESLGRVLAHLEGAEPLWDTFVTVLRQAQAAFVLEGNPIVEGLDGWLTDETNHWREVTSGDLYRELTAILFRGGKPTAEWPKTASVFGKELKNIRRELRTLYEVHWAQRSGRTLVYQFAPKPPEE